MVETCGSITSSVIDVGPTNVLCGAYILRIMLAEPRQIQFGRFQAGRKIALSPGAYLYVGSAMSHDGTRPVLAQRTLRHARRSGPQQAHAIYSKLLKHFSFHDFVDRPVPQNPKTLFWHVDYLLDESCATLQTVYLIRSQQAQEDMIAGWLLDQPECVPVANGLGASDRPHSTHLLHVRANAHWWEQLHDMLSHQLT